MDICCGCLCPSFISIVDVFSTDVCYPLTTVFSRLLPILFFDCFRFLFFATVRSPEGWSDALSLFIPERTSTCVLFVTAPTRLLVGFRKAPWEQYCVWMADSAVQAALISAVFLFLAGPPT